jgi:AraC family transcriptional regulator
VLHLNLQPLEVPEGHLLNHVVTLNLGGVAHCESTFGSRGWQTHRTPHHGIGVYPALVRYAARARHPRELMMVELSPEFVAAAAGSGAELRPILGVHDPFAAHVVLALAEEARAGHPGRTGAENLGAALVLHLLQDDLRAERGHGNALAGPRLRRVLDHVEANLDRPLSLRELAACVEMDVFRFVRAFKQGTGVPPHRFVLEARIERAKALLRDPALSISDVALRTGFATPSHFAATFRRIAGATPRAYRGAIG